MDDFLSGPQNFTLFVDSKDRFNLSQPHEGQFSITLPKPIELTPGTWEVCLKSLIITPSLNPLLSGIDNQIKIFSKNDDLQTKEDVVNIDVSNTDKLEPDLLDLVTIFNDSIPDQFKKKVVLQIKDETTKLKLDNVQIKYNDSPFTKVMGFVPEVVYPYAVEKNQWFQHRLLLVFTMTEICRVITDFTAPIPYGSNFLPIVGVGIVPISISPININFPRDVYYPVIKTYISKLSIGILNCDDKPFPCVDYSNPIILQFHFRQRSQFS